MIILEFLLANTRSGKIESSFCNNVNVSTTTSTFNTEQYYLVSKNTGGSCTEFSFSTARRTIPNSGYITKYLLASASAYIITGYTPNYLNATTLSALIQNTSTTQIPSQNLKLLLLRI